MCVWLWPLHTGSNVLAMDAHALQALTGAVQRLLAGAQPGARPPPRRVASRVVAEVAAVVAGVKPCLLFDAWDVDPASLRAAVDKISAACERTHPVPSPSEAGGRSLDFVAGNDAEWDETLYDNALAVVRLPAASASLKEEGEASPAYPGSTEEDGFFDHHHLLICRPRRLGKELECRLTEEGETGGRQPLPVVVDVSAGLAVPRLLLEGTDGHRALVREWLLAARSLRMADPLQAGSGMVAGLMDLPVAADCCVAALLGLLLGYPCVYHAVSAANCLAMAPLVLHRVSAAMLSPPRGTSCAGSGRWGDGDAAVTVLSSFSYPLACQDLGSEADTDSSAATGEVLEAAAAAWELAMVAAFRSQWLLSAPAFATTVVILPMVAL